MSFMNIMFFLLIRLLWEVALEVDAVFIFDSEIIWKAWYINPHVVSVWPSGKDFQKMTFSEFYVPRAFKSQGLFLACTNNWFQWLLKAALLSWKPFTPLLMPMSQQTCFFLYLLCLNEKQQCSTLFKPHQMML